MSANLYELLQLSIQRGASDLHITTGSPPQMRINGKLSPVGSNELTASDTKQMCYSILTESQKHRFRANIFIQRGAVAAAIRSIPFQIRSFEELGLPPIVKELVKKPRGLVLVTGPTGSGKSTTLATMIDMINSQREEHIVTIEDPIEFIHTHKKCVVNQREVHSDTKSFKNALKYILRQDPDVVLIGEMRDLETIEAALTISETGHLTFATLHTNSCAQTMNRIVDVFPAHQQPQIRAQLSFVLEGVISQQLLAKKGGTGRVLCLEVMVPNPAIRNLIREDKIHQIYSIMQTGQNKYGMQTMNQSLHELFIRGMITKDEAIGRSNLPDELLAMINRGGIGSGGEK